MAAYHSESKGSETLDAVALPVDVITRASCRLSSCIVETNIALLPTNLRRSVDKAASMLILERTNRELLGEKRASWYTMHPLSSAVDGLPNTSFRSPEGGLLLLHLFVVD